MTSRVDFTNENTYAQTRLPVSLASTLNPEAYRNPDYFEQEKKQLWSKSWICVGYTQQCEHVGDTFPAEVGDQSIIITRSDPKTISAFYNVCRHRGAKLIDKPGNHSFFRCPYHAWGYDIKGTLKGAPYFKDDEITPELKQIYDNSGAKDFKIEDYPLLPVKVSVWGCFVFVNLDPNCESLEKHLGDIPQRLKNYPFEALKLGKSAQYHINANWKLVAENYMEYYHLPTVHPWLNKVSHLTNHFEFQGPGSYYGMTTRPLEKDPDVPLARELAHMPGLDAEEDVSARWIWLFPNFSVSMLPDYMIVMIIAPDGAAQTNERYDYFFHPDTMAKPSYKEGSEAVFKFWHEVNVEDIQIVEAVQKGIANQEYKGGRMCFRFETNIHRFQNHVIDCLTGKPPSAS